MTAHIAFYQFVAIEAPRDAAATLREMASGLLGSVLVAPEGINGMLAGAPDALDRFEAALRDASFLGGALATIVCKRTTCRTAPFGRLKVRVKKEIVAMHEPSFFAPARTRDIAAAEVAPAEWDALIARPDVVLIDNRNSFEYAVGRFAGAIDPKTTNFSDFPTYVRAHAETWRAEGKTVAMYCTGGIRCDKASAWMQDLGVSVRQLRGGILGYLMDRQAQGGASPNWQGDCIVFDNRIALNRNLEECESPPDNIYAPEDAWRRDRAARLQRG